MTTASYSGVGSRVIADPRLREACATVYAAVIAVPQADRMDVTAVALRALVDTGALAKPEADRG